VARLGGDEFAIIQPVLGQAEDAGVLARRLLWAFRRPFRIDGRAITVGLSIGAALAPDHGTKGDEILRKADAALYRSKRAGRDRFTLHGDPATA
jgi:diguanylate cyclase (GGDEF)-like protein